MQQEDMKTRTKSKLISFFTDAPERVPPEQQSFFSAIMLGFLIAFVYHIGLVIYWQILGIQEMVIYHFIGFPLLFIGGIVTKIGRPRIGLIFGTVEYIVHAVLGTLCIGWMSGMHFPIPTAALLWTIIPGRKKPFNRIAPILSLILYLVLLYFSFDLQPRYEVAPIVLKWSAVVMGATLVAVSLVLFLFNSLATGWWESLQKEREKSEHLLLNVLPEKIAERLKEKEEVIADRFDSVSVLFLDIVEFTKMSANMAAHQVVTILNDVFCLFDTLTEKHGLEKIKTIGDAYMVVAGIPDSAPDHARRIIEMAIDMMAVLEKYSESTEHKIEARIGICSGPVVAGVIGRRKFIYDLWGDTVNTASRMESNGMPNRIQVTQATYDILRYDYEFEPRGEIEIKGKGMLQTYFLKHEELAARRKETIRPDAPACAEDIESEQVMSG